MKKSKLTKRECTVVYSLGAAVYSCLEVLWRGFTHWTMFFVGGACFFTVYVCEKASDNKKITFRALRAGLIITVIEFISGCIINKLFKLGVWDYSKLKLNLYGQICLLYSALWFLLGFPVCLICKALRKHFK